MSFPTSLRLQATPHSSKQEEDDKRVIKCYKNTGIALVVLGVALAILGIALLAVGNLGGIAPLILSIPFLFIGGNFITLTTNMEKIAKNPELIREDGTPVDRERVRKLLTKGTLGCDCLIKKMYRDY